MNRFIVALLFTLMASQAQSSEIKQWLGNCFFKAEQMRDQTNREQRLKLDAMSRCQAGWQFVCVRETDTRICFDEYLSSMRTRVEKWNADIAKSRPNRPEILTFSDDGFGLCDADLSEIADFSTSALEIEITDADACQLLKSFSAVVDYHTLRYY